ncbi:MAG: hypothetical protein FD133_487 [Erysipelotrichaceae bacterium]|nr:MAG: hypothetical protein FD179_1426 [Erysipelotrichaceae bacterium]TXT19127.1 MAG: hypothetical protein FD133_487 [Erysipelotrichaceae bacterium]
MKIRIKPFGIVGLVRIVFYILFIAAAISIFVVALIIQTNQYLYLSIFAIWPLFRLFYRSYQKSVTVDGKTITFIVDHEMKDFFRLPKGIVEEFDLDKLKFYGVFTGIYIQDITKAKRGIKNSHEYDVVKVKEGEFKMNVGTLTIGSPLAFVFQDESYVLDDSTFSEIQIATLFRVLEENTKMAPSGALESADFNKPNSISLIQFAKMTLVLITGLIIAFYLPFLQKTLTKSTAMVFTFEPLQITYMFMFVFGTISLIMHMFARTSISKDNNFKESLGSTTLVLSGVFMALTLIIFIVSLVV